MLEFKDAVELLEGRISRANSHWTFLFTVDIAVVGWLVSRTARLPVGYRVTVVSVMAVVYAFNLAAILRAQREMILLDAEVKEILKKTHEGDLSGYRSYLRNRSFTSFPRITVPLYLAGSLVILVLLWVWP
jgi:hypothetical protein